MNHVPTHAVIAAFRLALRSRICHCISTVVPCIPLIGDRVWAPLSPVTRTHTCTRMCVQHLAPVNPAPIASRLGAPPGAGPSPTAPPAAAPTPRQLNGLHGWWCLPAQLLGATATITESRFNQWTAHWGHASAAKQDVSPHVASDGGLVGTSAAANTPAPIAHRNMHVRCS